MRVPGKGHLQLRVPIDTIASNLDEMGDFPFKDPDEARYEGPSLFIRGTRSHYVPDDVLPLVRRFFPRFQVCDIESGHWVISEKPEAFRHGKMFVILSRPELNVSAVVEFLEEEHQGVA